MRAITVELDRKLLAYACNVMNDVPEIVFIYVDESYILKSNPVK